MKLYERGDKLYVEYSMDGKRIRKSLNLKSTQSNKLYAYREIIPEIERKIKYDLNLDGYKLSEFTDIVLEDVKQNKKLNTYLLYQHAVKEFFKIMGDVNIGDVRTIDIDRYVRKLIEKGKSSSTITTYLAPIRSAFKEAIRLDIIIKNPVIYVKKPSVKHKKKKPFNMLQMKTLIDKSDGELKIYLFIAFFTGARPNEIISLKWEDITDKHISINKTFVRRNIINKPKNGKTRNIPILKPLKKFLSSLKRGKDHEFVFIARYDNIFHKFKKLLEEVGYQAASLHVTRHTFTSIMLQSRQNPTMIQYFLGHSSLDMINTVYAHYIEDDNELETIGNILSM